MNTNTDFRPFNILPDEDIVAICEQMSIDALQNFVLASHRQHDVCQEILEERLLDERLLQAEIEKRAKMRQAIMRRLPNLRQGQILDVSKLTPTGDGARIIGAPSARSNLRKVPGYDIYALPEQIVEIQELLSDQ